MPEYSLEGTAHNVRVRGTVVARSAEAAQRKADRGAIVWWYADDQPDFRVTVTTVKED